MSIDRQHGFIIIACETCSETFEGESNEWNEVWPAAKTEGWTAKKIGKEWEHRCPECRDS
jgi:hypothetical protein